MLRNILKILGPGILFASMAIGTSHLVLSTKAGAEYGLVMIIPIVLANLLKWPFFEFGVRYTFVQKESLIMGYQRLGQFYLGLYALITLVSAFTILAALYLVTAGLFSNLLQLSVDSLTTVSGVLFLLISAILVLGKYKWLEISLKSVVFVLFVSLLITTIMVVVKPHPQHLDTFTPKTWSNAEGILFLIGLIGWMPTAVEASGWVSLWNVEKLKSPDANGISLKNVLGEFNLGYFLTALFAIFFFIIGWRTLYGTGLELSGNAVAFSDQLISIFTTHIGQWSYYFIAAAALTTLFSTCLSAHDALARVSEDVLQKSFKLEANGYRKFSLYVLVLAGINWLVILNFQANMGILIAIATFCSFVFAPVLGWMNLKVFSLPEFPDHFSPKKPMRLLAWTGIVFLSLFAAYYCYVVFAN